MTFLQLLASEHKPPPIVRRKVTEPPRELDEVTKAKLIALHSWEAFTKISPHLFWR